MMAGECRPGHGLALGAALTMIAVLTLGAGRVRAQTQAGLLDPPMVNGQPVLVSSACHQ